MNPHLSFTGARKRIAEYLSSESGSVHSRSALVAGAILTTSALGTLIGANSAEAIICDPAIYDHCSNGVNHWCCSHATHKCGAHTWECDLKDP